MRIVLRSEKHAWEEVKRRCMAAQRRGASVEELRALFIECDAIADTMIAQLDEGIHKNPPGRGYDALARYAVISVNRDGTRPARPVSGGSATTKEMAIGVAKSQIRFYGGAYGVEDTKTGRIVWWESSK